MEDEPLFGRSAADHLAEAIALDRAGNALDMRRARLLAVLKRMDHGGHRAQARALARLDGGADPRGRLHAGGR